MFLPCSDSFFLSLTPFIDIPQIFLGLFSVYTVFVNCWDIILRPVITLQNSSLHRQNRNLFFLLLNAILKHPFFSPEKCSIPWCTQGNCDLSHFKGFNKQKWVTEVPKPSHFSPWSTDRNSFLKKSGWKVLERWGVKKLAGQAASEWYLSLWIHSV